MEYRIDCTIIDSAREFHFLLARELRFPRWYAHNLDALHDVLTSLAGPTCLVLENWDDARPYARGFHRVFEDCARENPGLTVIFQ